MRLHLRYWNPPTSSIIIGGSYSDWKQLLAMVPIELLDHRMKIQLGSYDNVYVYIWL